MATCKKLVMSQLGHAAQLGIKFETQNPEYPDQISKKTTKNCLSVRATAIYLCFW